MPYNRQRAIEYAHKWAFARNPAYYDFSNVGGDCTNFVSQCLLAGGAPMDYTKDLGWYYSSAGNRAPAWSGVTFLFNYLTRPKTRGLIGRVIPMEEIEPGDVVQMSFGNNYFTHTQLVVEVVYPASLATVLIATHTIDSDYRPVSSYELMKQYRCLKISVVP
jgi:hypothetical protein